MIETVRRAREADAATIVEFNRRMALETEGKSLDAGILARGVARALADDAKGFYLLAISDAAIVGQVMITREWSDWRDGWFWWIQSVYVREDWRQRGVFRALYRAVEREARAAGIVIGLRLYVERDNQPAQLTYQALGMANANYLVYEALLSDTIDSE
jgi:ribosomal protein S18 acetylase RimI-like enzyme